MTQTTELAELPPQETALEVYSKPSGLEPWLDKIAAEQRAEQERLAAIEREKQAAEAARQAEIKRQADAKAAEEAEAARREADRAHKAKVNRTALTAFVKGGMTEECAKLAITLIAKGGIPAIKITY